MAMLLLPVIAVVFLSLGLLVLGRRKPGYSHLVHTISELGEVGAPDQRLVAWAVFLPVGLLMLPVVVGYRVSSPPVAALAACIATGYLVAAWFPCDPGSPVSGSTRQSVHNLGGAIQYIGGGLCLVWVSDTLGAAPEWLGFGVIGVAFALTFLPAVSVRGLVQRIGEIGLFGGLALSVSRLSGGL